MNEVTKVPITLSQYTLMAVVGLGGLCIAAFLVLTQGDSIWAVPGPLVEQEVDGEAQAADRQDEAGVGPGLARERQRQPDDHGDGRGDTEPSSLGKHGVG